MLTDELYKPFFKTLKIRKHLNDAGFFKLMKSSNQNTTILECKLIYLYAKDNLFANKSRLDGPSL